MFNLVLKRRKISATGATIARRVLYPRVLDKNIHVVLLRDLTSYGRSGDIVEVPRGFANHNLIPRGLAVYATWENIDLYAKAPVNKANGIKSDACEKGETVGAANGFLSGAAQKIKYSIQVRTLSRNPSLVSSPVSLYTVLDLLSKNHQIEILPSQVIKVISKHNSDEYLNVKRFSHIGEYIVQARVPLAADPEATFSFEVELKNREDQNDTSMENKFQLPQQHVN